jgi:hypothetical protein
MAGTDLGTLVRRTRRFVGDYRDIDTITASCSSTANSITVTDTTSYNLGEKIEIDYETMIVRARASATSLTVARGAYDSTAATHSSGASVLKPVDFTFSEYVDALNAALDMTFPLLYRPVVDESLTAVSGTYEYTIPNMPETDESVAVPIPYISQVFLRMTGDVPFRREYKNWNVLRGSTPKLVFRSGINEGTIRIEGFGPFPHLSAPTDTLHALFPKRAERPVLVEFASQWLLASGEARRVRGDTGVTDAREQANRTGSSMAAAGGIYQRASQALLNLAMPPMPKSVVGTV